MLTELRAFILADPTVAGLIGTRFYPSILPQNPTLPAVTFQLVSVARAPTMRHNDNMPSKRIQIDAWAKRIDEASQVAEAIRSLFHYYQPQDMGGIYVAGVFADNGRMLFEDVPMLHRMSYDYIVWHEET